MSDKLPEMFTKMLVNIRKKKKKKKRNNILKLSKFKIQYAQK